MRINNIFSFIFVLFSLSSAVSGQNAYDTQIKKGLDLAYNFQLTEAEDSFSKAMELMPERPEAYHFNAQIHIWAFLGSKDKAELRIFNRWSDISIDKARAIYNKNKNDYKINYILGEIYLLKAAAEGADNSLLNAFSATKTSFSFLKRAIELNASFYDAYRGLGLIHYTLDFIPGVFKWAVSLTGLKADRDKGLYYLYNAYQKGYEGKTESAFHLARLYSEYAGEHDNAMAVLTPLLNRFPGNPVFNYQAAVILMKKGEFEEAEKYLDKIISLNNKAVSRMNSLSLFLKGDVKFRENDFKNAKRYYEQFVNSARDPDYTGIANLRLAVCCFANGERELFKNALYNARSGNGDLSDDDFARRVSEKMNGRDFTQEEILLIKARNDCYCHKYNNVINSLSQRVFSFSGRGIKAAAFITLAECYLALKNSEGTEKNVAYFISNGTGDAKWTEAYSFYLRALIEYYKGNFDKAKEFYEEAVNSNDYDFKDEISLKLNNLKRKIFKN